MEEQKNKKILLDRRKLLAIGVSTLCVALIIVLTVLLYPRKTEPIDHFCRALQKGSYEELHKCMPQQAWNTLSAAYDKDGETNLKAEMLQLVTLTNREMTERLGGKLKITFRVTDKKDYDNEKLGAFAAILSEKFGLDADAVTEACEIHADTTSKGTKDIRTDEGELYIVYQYDGAWYLYFDPVSGT